MACRVWWLGIALVAVLAEPLLGPARAQVFRDPGNLTCATWNDARRRSRDPFDPFTTSITAWMQGYFAGAADLAFILVSQVDDRTREDLRRGRHASLSVLDGDRMPAWFDAYCPLHPDETIRDAARSLLRKAYSVQ